MDRVRHSSIQLTVFSSVREFILTKGWVDKEKFSNPTYDQIVDSEDSLEEMEAADAYEKKYNFRFEEP